MENQRVYGDARMVGLPPQEEKLMLLQTNDTVVKHDEEWVELIQIAIEMGIPLEEIREFLLGTKTVF